MQTRLWLTEPILSILIKLQCRKEHGNFDQFPNPGKLIKPFSWRQENGLQNRQMDLLFLCGFGRSLVARELCKYQSNPRPFRIAGFYSMGALPVRTVKKPPCNPKRFFMGEIYVTRICN
jgi:hypothetical protein